MKQLVQLQQNLDAFHAEGIAVVVLTYDVPELQQVFIDTRGIEYPMLSDVDAATVKVLNILNAEYEPGDGAYGIPYPGIFVVNRDLEIVGKIFVDGYQKRVDALHVLAYAKNLLE